MPSIVWLDRVDAQDLALVGGKAANLGELIRAGFDVPPGFVVTTQAHRRRIPGDTVPAVVADDIRAAWRELVKDTGALVAVRSSATAEDLAEASFAGQQETYLNVAGADAVVAAVADCWASLFGDRAIAYRAAHGVDEADLAMAVVVQLMVDADAAGVMFTANPVNGRRNETVITAARGLGEAVVAGTIDPDTFVIDTGDDTILLFRRGEPAVVRPDPSLAPGELVWTAGERAPQPLSDDRAVELARLGGLIEAHFGAPQDIEWAIDHAGFHLLQARPITALPDPVAEVPDVWPSAPGSMFFRASIVEQLPNPLTPLFAGLMVEAVPASLKALMADLAETFARPGILDDLDVGFPTINGYAYYRYSHRTIAKVTRVSLPMVRQLYARGGSTFIERWREVGLPGYREAVARWAGAELAGVAMPDLLAGVAELLGAGCRYYTYVQTVIPLSGTTELAWNALHRSLAGVARQPAETYLVGFDSAPVLAEKELWDLGQWIRSEPALAAAVAESGFDPEAAPDEVSPQVWDQWRRGFEAYLAGYGHTVYDLDFVNPVPADEPAPILQVLRFVVTGQAVDPYLRQERLAQERERATAALLAQLDPVRRRLVDRTLARARTAVPAREDALAAMGLAWPQLRRLLAEFGRRLVADGQLTDPDEVYWLDREEADELASGARISGLPEAIAERQALRRGQALLRPPQYLPVNRLMSVWDSFLPARVDAGTGNVLKGNAGSGGIVTGPARVIGGPSDFAGFVPGEILVAEITTPAYTPLFAVAGGVVTDVGGVLSHGSIVAREYGIPAVLGTGSATHRIQTGQTITVDGGRGEIRLEGVDPVEEPRNWIPLLAAAAAVAGGLVWLARRRRK